MSIHLYNTLSRKKEHFIPLNPDQVSMYVCGPTVYNFVHIGNARPAVVFDLLFRLLQCEYSSVVYARNFTDLDDRINQAAWENKESIETLSERYITAYREDMAELNILKPSLEPKATEHIDDMIAIIASLIEKKHAYCADNHVLFHVPSMENYGQLSGRDLEQMRAGARVDVEDYKRDPGDFVLWKPSDETQPGWQSPWGLGRPGWHLECSAMIKKLLGDTIDIHGGGLDLIFPHHENEIAQSCCANGNDKFVSIWMHNGFLTIDGEKMGKSLGNFRTVRDLLEHFQGESLRYALLTGHYRGPLDFTPSLLQQAKSSLDRLYTSLRPYPHLPTNVVPVPKEIVDALHDDLDTPIAIAHLHELRNQLNKADTDEAATPIKNQLIAAGKLMGFLQQDPEIWLKWQAKSNTKSLSNDEINTLVEERVTARESKNWARSDEIRDQLTQLNIILEDTQGHTKWRRQ